MLMCNNNCSTNLRTCNYSGSCYYNSSPYHDYNGSGYYYNLGSNYYYSYNLATHNYDLGTNNKCSSYNSIPTIKQYTSPSKHKCTSSKLHSRKYS